MGESWTDRVGAALGVAVEAVGARAVADVPAERWHEAVRTCRDRLGCDFFDWLSAVDRSEVEDAQAPMLVAAHLWSIAARRGVLLRCAADGPVDTVTDLYPGANWHERETHEMFGVDFAGHPDLKPLLLPPEFEGHPLRKDFVLASRVVKPWPGEKEPGGGRPGARKRAPKKPPGVPDGWGRPEEPTDA
ncbi:hypothetical protein GCM10027447_13680 [Glycomyces halotolerans]